MGPRPRANLLLHHGAFAARGCWRVAGAIAPCVARSSATPAAPPAAAAPPSAPPAGTGRPRHVAWAELLRRTFGLDVLACPHCGGRLRRVATLAVPGVIARILTHLGLPLDPPCPTPPRRPSWLPEDPS